MKKVIIIACIVLAVALISVGVIQYFRAQPFFLYNDETLKELTANDKLSVNDVDNISISFVDDLYSIVVIELQYKDELCIEENYSSLQDFLDEQLGEYDPSVHGSEKQYNDDKEWATDLYNSTIEANHEIVPSYNGSTQLNEDLINAVKDKVKDGSDLLAGDFTAVDCSSYNKRISFGTEIHIRNRTAQFYQFKDAGKIIYAAYIPCPVISLLFK